MSTPVLATWDQRMAGIQQAIALASGLDASKIVWGFQNVNAPSPPYISLSLGSLITRGQDYIRTTYSASRPAGQEIQQEVKGLREMMLNISVFADVQVGSVAKMPFGSGSSAGLAELIKSALLLPSVRDTLRNVQVSPFGPGAVQSILGIAGMAFRGRALLPVRCYVPAVAAVAYTTYIQTVSASVTVQKSDGTTEKTFTVPVTFPT